MTTLICSCAQIRRFEEEACRLGQATMAGLMEAAGRACALVVQRETPEGRVAVLAGPGNNGGDAFVAARLLAEWGRDVVVFEMTSDRPRSAEASAAREAYVSMTPAGGVIKPTSDIQNWTYDVVLDGLFGAGLTRPLSKAEERAVLDCRGSARRIAIDLPSGLQGDTGRREGVAMTCDITVTFGAKKPVHVLEPAASSCGLVEVADIGFRKQVYEATPYSVLENEPGLWLGQLLWPVATSHKHKRGRLGVVSGGPANTGAARLAAQAGLRVGAGSVTLLCPPAALNVAAASVTAVMTSAFETPEQLVQATRRSGCVVIGPAAGVTSETRANVEALLKAGRRLVLDADALSVFAGEAKVLQLLLSEAQNKWREMIEDEDRVEEPDGFFPNEPAIVITPHEGEFERLFPGVLASTPNKIEAAARAASMSGAIVVFKGADTVIGNGAKLVVNRHASPFLATAGTGDVLAGAIGGLLAKDIDPLVAACAGVWMHGDAGLRAGPGLTAEDLDAALRETQAALYAEYQRQRQ